jgi:hypothetical protein
MKNKALLVLLGGASVACDSTVNLDYQPRYFDELLASGICRAPDSVDDSQLDLSLQILSYTREGTVSLLPNDAVVIDGIPRQVEEELRSDDFEFALAANCNTEQVDPATFNACGERSDQPSPQTGLSLLGYGAALRGPGRRRPTRRRPTRGHVARQLRQPERPAGPHAVRRPEQGVGSAGRAADVLQEPRPPAVHPRRDLLLAGVVRSASATRHDGVRHPTRNRDVMVCPAGSDGATCRLDKAFDGLSQLERGEIGSTPLADALDQTYKIVINGKDTKQFNPVVILFTDGTERGDSSGSDKTLSQVTQTYANHTYGGQASPVPVIVLHLQPRLASGFKQGRDPELYALACATGGEYVFIERADEFTTSNTLEPLVANRIAGAWKLRVTSTDTIGLGAGQYLLSSELSLTLGGKKESTALTSSDDETEDTRLWFVK